MIHFSLLSDHLSARAKLTGFGALRSKTYESGRRSPHRFAWGYHVTSQSRDLMTLPSRDCDIRPAVSLVQWAFYFITSREAHLTQRAQLVGHIARGELPQENNVSQGVLNNFTTFCSVTTAMLSLYKERTFRINDK